VAEATSESNHRDCAELRERFAERGLRCTRQRVQIYKALEASKAHPTAEELFWLVRESDQDLSLATVYNTLDAFCVHGLCRRLATSAGPARYDADLSTHLHVQDQEGRIHDVPPDLSQRLLDAVGPDLLQEIGRATGQRITGARIELISGADSPEP
jgi:Fe2+ or Zn2+ uptake regulation protein